MIKAMIPLALCLAFATASAHAAGDGAKGKSKVQLGCSKQVGDRTGEEKKKFMQECVTAQRKAHDAKLAACRKEVEGEKSAAAKKKNMRDCMAKA